MVSYTSCGGYNGRLDDSHTLSWSASRGSFDRSAGARTGYWIW